MLNELMEFIAMSIKSEDLDSGEILCVCLGGTHWHVGNTSGTGCQTYGLRCLTDGCLEHIKQS